jgi:membrane protease YdiL (CAAX protease family)
MQQGIYKNAGFSTKVFQLIAIVLFSIVLLSVLTVLFTDGDLNNISSVKQMQLIQSLCLFVFVPFTLAYFWSEDPLSYLKLSSKSKFSTFMLVLITMVVAIPGINLLTSFNQQLVLPDFMAPLENWMKASETQLEEITLKMLNVNTIQALLFNLFLMAILPALGEELFFRGIIQKIITERKNAIIAIWVAAFIFSAIHMQFYGFLPRMLLGAFFGYLVYWSGNLWLPIVAHFVNNGIAVLFYYLKFNGVKVFDIDTIGTGETIYTGAISVVLTAFCITKLRKELQNLL